MPSESQDIAKYLVVGRQVTIQPEPHKGTKLRYQSAMRGWRKGSYIVLDSPPGSEGVLAIVGGLPCAIRFMNEGHAYAFYTRVMESTSKKSPFLRVQWPQDLQGVQVRRHERAKVKLPCTLSFEDGRAVEGELCDLSLGGCRITCEDACEEASAFTLKFHLPDGCLVDGVVAVVRSASPMKEGVCLGCEFSEIDDGALHDIDFFVSNSFQRLREPSAHAVNVLFIGPETSELTPLKERLEAFNCDVCIVSSTVDGMFRLRLVPPLAVMIDYDQPDMPGIEVCRLLRKTRGLEKLPIFIFGGGESDGTKACREVGATRYFRSLREMHQVLESIVREHTSADEDLEETDTAAASE
jgi:c-di-GMP-binding flagellar brake protein YcgR